MKRSSEKESTSRLVLLPGVRLIISRTVERSAVKAVSRAYGTTLRDKGNSFHHGNLDS